MDNCKTELFIAEFQPSDDKGFAESMEDVLESGAKLEQVLKYGDCKTESKVLFSRQVPIE